MNIARLLKADERSHLFKAVTGRSAVWQIPKPQRPQIPSLHRQYPTVSAPRQINDRARKSTTQNLLWVDMITNALIVIAIASASYFLIGAKGLRANIDPAVTSYSERSELR
jgi:hypothetical protein